MKNTNVMSQSIYSTNCINTLIGYTIVTSNSWFGHTRLTDDRWPGNFFDKVLEPY